MTHTHRVVHVGTGYTGSIALQHVLSSPQLELVGHLVSTPEKVGRDSGEVIGGPPVGVRTTDRLDELLAIDADCVTYFAPMAGRDLAEVLGDLCALLASGKSVVTPSVHPLFHPDSLDDVSRAKLTAACAQGRTSVFATGIAPGFTTDMLAVHAASMSSRPTEVAIEERVPCGAYRVPGFFAMLGFGRSPAADAAAYRPGSMIPAFAAPMRLLAQGLGLEVDEIVERRDIAVADRDYRFVAGDIPKGTVASVRMTFVGLVSGGPRLRVSTIWSMPDEAVEGWQPAIAEATVTRRLTRITVDGNPPVQLDFALTGGELPGSAATAARVINAIPAVCAAQPGILSGLDLVVPAHARR